VSSGVGPVKMSHDEYTDKITDSIMRDFEVRAMGGYALRNPVYDPDKTEGKATNIIYNINHLNNLIQINQTLSEEFRADVTSRINLIIKSVRAAIC
jgi:hypothetical protein